MNNKEKFIEWMINNSKISQNTINKYSSAITTISKELTEYSINKIDIYEEVNPFEIDKLKEQYLNIDYLREKDKRGNRMYTSSLNWYKKYLEKNNNTLFKDSLNECSIVYKKIPKGEFIITEGKKQWKRDRSIVDRSIEFSKNKCEYDNNHKHFISNKSGKNYVEGHHLIPIKYQDDFEYSLDVEANIVSLCVVCHKILHFGKIEDKINIINKLYKLRSNSLKLSGLEITLNDLINLYR